MGWYATGVTRTRIQVIGVNFSLHLAYDLTQTSRGRIYELHSKVGKAD